MLNDSIDNLRLDLNKEKVRGVIYVRSGDTMSRTIHISLMSNGQVVDLSEAVFCELLIKKPDLNECDQTMVRYGNELQYTFRTQDVNVPGECKCQVMITFADSAVITSPEFSVMVYDKEINPAHEESMNEYTAISQILVDVTDMKHEVAENTQKVSDSEENVTEMEAQTKEYRDEAEDIAQGLDGVLMPQGRITFAELADVYKVHGFVWTITDSFTTDARFAEGAGNVMAAGTSVYVDINDKLACISGEIEINHQTGTFEMAVSRENIATGETIATILGKLKKYLNDLKTVSFSGSYTDLSNKPDYDGLASRVGALETSVGDILGVLGYPYDPPIP